MLCPQNNITFPYIFVKIIICFLSVGLLMMSFFMSALKLCIGGLWQIAVSRAISTGSTQPLATLIPLDKKISYGIA